MCRVLNAAWKAIRKPWTRVHTSGEVILNTGSGEDQCRVGILIVGSLLWSEENSRPQWRDERLIVEQKRRVSARIRYGRFSTGRDTYTITFSLTSQPGSAFLVPCRLNVTTFEDVLEEAHRLARAEGLLNDNGTWKTFGIVCMAVNPTSQSTAVAPIRDGWPQYFDSRLHANSSFWKAYEELGEPPPVSTAGFLQFDWPAFAVASSGEAADLLLATATVPTPKNGSHPTPHEIGSWIVEEPRASYFRGNVINGIRTAEDRAIWREILAAGRQWRAAAEYARISALLKTSEPSS